MRPTTRTLACLALAALFAPACSIKQLTVRTTADVLKEGSRAMESEPDVEVARAAVPSQLKTVEGLLVSAPDNRTLLEMAARGCMEYAFGFLEDDVETLAAARKDAPQRRAATARAIAMYERAFDHALRLLETFDPDIRAALAQGGSAWDAAVGRLPADSVPGLTFGGMALASALNVGRADPARLADLPKARAMLERSYAIDRRFYFGGAAMTLGIIRAQLGDREGAARYFHDAIDASGGEYLLPRVMMARTLLVAKRDRAGFKATLQAALDAPRDAFPSERLANEIARRRAARYLGGIDGMFPDSRRD